MENEIAQDLRLSLDRDEIHPYFQPQVSLQTGTLIGFEVLARWHHPLRGVILPSAFIAVAEDQNLIGRLTRSILCNAFTAISSIPGSLRLAVNLSSSQLRDPAFPEELLRIADVHGFALQRLTIELTESALLEKPELALSIAVDLKRLGVRLALDDFGTGFSSLTSLQTLPFDELKVDQSFVRSMLLRRECRKIVAAVVGLGRTLNLVTVGEGIENYEQADMLLCLGCELGQGFLYGEAVPGMELATTIESLEIPALANRQMPFEESNVSISLEALPSQRLAQFNAIYDGAPVGLCFLDCNLRYVNINRRLAEMNGIPVRSHLGRTVAEVVPHIFSEAQPYLLRTLQGEVISGVELKKPDPSACGEWRTILTSYQPARDEAGEVVGVSIAVIDITERKRSDQALQESEDHYRNMVDLNPHIPWTMSPNGENTEISPRWEELTGFSPERTNHLGWLTGVIPADLELTTHVVEDCLRSGARIDLEYRVLSSNGLCHWMRSRGAPLRNAAGDIMRWYGSVEQVDDRKKAEEDLRASEARLQAVIDAIPIGIVIAVAPTGCIVSRNPEAEKILEQTIHFSAISDYSERVSYSRNGRRLETADFPLARAIQQGLTTEPFTVFYDPGRGEEKWISLTGAPICDKEGKITGAVATIQELTCDPRSGTLGSA
ncbi:EAL domain-containing protein [Granulicella arctica]|uniref:EAL domain-containing protein n=1 Tax=Granulicella arctica TaxID=940613 RepID=UPI0021DF9A6E|nr:EAL domain-containing protein [Granulicella arctica]